MEVILRVKTLEEDRRYLLLVHKHQRLQLNVKTHQLPLRREGNVKTHPRRRLPEALE